MSGTVTRILGIAPYDSMRISMEKIARDYPNVHADIYTGDLEEGLAIVQGTFSESYDVIISRGGTAKLLEEFTSVPVISIQLSVYDVLRAMKMAENYSSKYAIVGFPDITEPAHTLCDLLKYNVEIFTVQNASEVPAVLDLLRDGGHHMVVCDAVTHTVAQQWGFDAFLITSGTESLRAAFDEAISVSTRFRELKHENLILQRIAQGGDGNTVILDNSGKLYYSLKASPKENTLSVFREHIPALTSGSAIRFYYSIGSSTYSAEGSTIYLGSEQYYMYSYSLSRIPLRSGKTGVRSYNDSEVSQFITNSFFTISGVTGELEGRLDAIAASIQPVMVIGERGTGKEQAARLLYLRGPRTKRPFVTVDCSLMDDKTWDYLFNHFSSPLNERNITVYFQACELMGQKYCSQLISAVTDTDIISRVKLIFSCDSKGDSSMPESVRPIASKLGCFMLNLPTLRSRSDEIPSLAGLYLAKLNREYGKQIIGFDPRALELLRSYEWPNNYTQFKQFLSELVTLTDASYIRGNEVASLLSREQALNLSNEGTISAELLAGKTLEEISREAVRQTLDACGGNQTEAARRLGISRTTIWRYMKDGESNKK